MAKKKKKKKKKKEWTEHYLNGQNIIFARGRLK